MFLFFRVGWGSGSTAGGTAAAFYDIGKLGKSSNASKVRQLGPTNWIVYDSDSKASEFDRRYQSDSKSDVKIVLSIAILIHI